MCLAVPAEVVKVEGARGLVSVGGLRKLVGLELLGEVNVGDYVMVHAGYAIERVDFSVARQMLDMLAVGAGHQAQASAAATIVDRIRQLAAGLGDVTFMEVCGTHTMAIARHGLRQLLPDNVRLTSGPGCPVCVTPTAEIDAAIAASRRDVTVTTFGDMLNVPGSAGTLADVRADGADVRVVYSVYQAMKLALDQPDRLVVFLGVGFETTAPTVAAAVEAAAERAVDNFTVLSMHKLIPPAMLALLAAGEVRIDGFICPGHVSAVIGADSYRPIVTDHRAPCVVTGFEALDILEAVRMLLLQITEGDARLENEYQRTVRAGGNPTARQRMMTVFEPVDAAWRGLGVIPDSGLAVREEFAGWDAQRRLSLRTVPVPEPAGCRCGDILRGVNQPADCPLLGRTCTPDKPVGPCMVSSEGACRAVWMYEVSSSE